LRGLPPQQPVHPTDPRTPRYWKLAYHSPAAHRAVLAVAARTGTHPGPVRLAAFAVALGRVTGDRMVVLQTLVHNRFRPGFTGSVGMLTQSGLCVVDVGNSTFDEVVGRAWQATARAGKHAYYDPDELGEMIATVGRDRGDDLDISCFYNDRGRHVPRPPADRAPTRADVLSALPRSTMRWAHRFDSYDRSIAIHINDVPDALDCMICVDTHRIAPAQLVALARGIEAVVVAAALDPAAPTGVPAHSGTVPDRVRRVAVE
jgi:non-ribosomal peptide synthetase component F